jgi:hypothetical protein
MILLELTRCFQGVLVDQGSLRGSHSYTFERPVSFIVKGHLTMTPLTMKETGLSKRQEIPSREPPSPHVAGANPRSTRSGKCISAASSQGFLEESSC